MLIRFDVSLLILLYMHMHLLYVNIFFSCMFQIQK